MWIAIIAAIALLIIICILVIYHDTHNFVVREYEVSTDKLSKDITFVLLSDLHGYVFGKDNERIIAAVDDIKPDYILCAGDMLTGSKVKTDADTIVGRSLLNKLSSKYPVYISNGNHEERLKELTKALGNLFDRYKSSLVRAGATYLENESVDLAGENIRITGLELPIDYYQKVIKKKMEPGVIEDKIGNIKDKKKFQVLIAHNPQYFPEYADWGADLTVSGHVHGGIIRLPLLGGVISPAITLFPRYDGGKYEKNGRTMILSRGLGTHTIHVRMFNPGEVAVIRVKGGRNVT